MHKSAFQGVRAAALAIVALTATPGHAGSKASPEMAATKVPIVRQTVLAFDVGTAGGLSADERRSLSEWFDGIKVRYGDRVSVDAAGACLRRLRRACRIRPAAQRTCAGNGGKRQWTTCRRDARGRVCRRLPRLVAAVEPGVFGLEDQQLRLRHGRRRRGCSS